jgi:PAS domain S-box-containing protein
MLLDVLKGGYNLIAKYSSEMVDIFDLENFRCIYASPANLRYLGYHPEEMIGKNCLDLVHPEDLPYVKNKMVEGLIQGRAKAEFRARKKDGSYIWIEVRGYLINNSEGYKEILLVTRDIHDRKMAQEALKQQFDYLNTIINNMDEFCYTYNNNFRVTFVNQKTVEGTGYTREEILGRSVFDLVHPDDRERVYNLAQQRLQKKEVERYEHRLICKDGRELLVCIKGSPIVVNGEVKGAVILCDDISEYKKMQSEMVRLDQMHIVGEIAAGLAHEIRNPMTTVKGFLQLLIKDEVFYEKQQYLEIMIEELNRANAIIGEFLSLARNKVADLKICQINNIIRSLAPLLQADAFLSDRTIVLKLGEVPELLLDVKEIRQLIINLVRNALEATHRGGMVEIATWKKNSTVMLSVKDRGEGIPAEIMERLGTPFVSTKDNGTGLGLAVCFGIIERHQANLDIETSPAGTTFTVKFNCPSHDNKITANG